MADRHFLDPIFKEVMTFNFAQLALPVETQVEINLTYIYYASRVEPEITKEVLKMAGKQNLYEKQLQRIIDSMGTDLLKKMTPEERVCGLTVSKRVRGLTVSEMLAGLDPEDLRALDPEEKSVLLQLLDQPDKTQN